MLSSGCFSCRILTRHPAKCATLTHKHTKKISVCQGALCKCPASKKSKQKIKIPNGVFEASVSGSGIHQIFGSQLFDVSESLELRSVDDLHQQGVQLHGTMNGVFEDLQHTEKVNNINLSLVDCLVCTVLHVCYTYVLYTYHRYTH